MSHPSERLDAASGLSALESGPRPALARRSRLLRLHRRALARAAGLRALAEAFSLHLVLLTLFGALSASDPWQTLWPKAALAAWAVYLWPAARLMGARRRPGYSLEALAASLDRLNPDAPDIHRTLLSAHRHDPKTLDALETLYAAWEPRLRVPAPPRLSPARKVVAASALVFALGFPFVAAHVARDLFPGGPGEIFERAWLPARALSNTPAPRLTPVELPEDATLGDTLALKVRLDHVPARRPVYVHVIQGDEETRFEMEHAPDTAFFRLGPVTRDIGLRFSTRGFATRVYRVRKVPPPRLNRLSVVVTPPAYARRPAEPVEHFAEMPALLAVLPGSRIVWTAEAAEPLVSLKLEMRVDGGAERARELGAGETYVFEHVAREAFESRLRLRNARGGTAAEGPFRIELKADMPPEIALIEPAGDQDLGRNLRLPLYFRAKDDFGVSRISLRYLVPREGGKPIEGNVNVTSWLDRRSGAGMGTWNASELPLEAGDVVELWLEAADNDAVSGPKTARTPSIRLRLPSREEARASVEAGERDAAVSLSSALERERRSRRESERPDKGASGDATLQAMPEWELQRILSDQPRQHSQETKRQIEAELRRAEAKTEARIEAKTQAKKDAAALRELQRELEAQEKRLPPPSVARAPAEEQKRALERLNEDQKALEQKLAKTAVPKAEASASPNEKREARDQAENRERLQESLRRNLEDQRDLKNWMAERERVKGAEQARAEQANKHAERMRQDMEKALEQIDQAMQKGLENGALSPEMLEKMERIRELVEEVLDADEKQALRESSQGPVDAGDVQRAMQEILEKKDGVKQSLESAIRMLEALKETRALRDLAADVRELGADQKDLANRMESPEKAADLAAEQQQLAQRLEAARQEMDRLAKKPEFSEVEPQKQGAREARAAMQQAIDALKKPRDGDRKAAKQGADLAAKKLQKAAEQMEKSLAKMDAPSDAAELRAALEETLELSRWLETLRDPREGGAERRAWGGEPGARQGAVRVSRWLVGRLQRLADGRPFDGDVLRREAAAMSVQADALATASSPEALDALRRHAQASARELLKWLNEDKDGGGSEAGDGQGDTDEGGGDSGDSGNEGMSGRLKGASARQGAVNQATQDLLQSFLRQRQGSSGGQQGQSGQSGGSPGAGGKPSRGEGGGQQPGGEDVPQGEGQGSRSSGDRGSQGSEGSGGTGAQDARSLANAQQRIGESLEQWAESAEDGGGAARKLRQLAAEARELEAALRGRRLSPEETRLRQERFRTRLLEAANALEERGRERERRAEAYKGGATALAPEGAIRDEEWLRVLKRRREEARRLPLTPAQKRRVEWYYDQLLNP